MIRQSLSSSVSVKRREAINSGLIRNRISSWTRPELVTPPPTNWFAKSTYKSRQWWQRNVYWIPINEARKRITQTVPYAKMSYLKEQQLAKGCRRMLLNWLTDACDMICACVSPDLWADLRVNSIHLLYVSTRSCRGLQRKYIFIIPAQRPDKLIACQEAVTWNIRA